MTKSKNDSTRNYEGKKIVNQTRNYEGKKIVIPKNADTLSYLAGYWAGVGVGFDKAREIYQD